MADSRYLRSIFVVDLAWGALSVADEAIIDVDPFLISFKELDLCRLADADDMLGKFAPEITLA